MASPQLPFITLRLLGVSEHSTKRDIEALFEPDDSKRILFVSLAKAVLGYFSASQIATITFANRSHTIDKLVQDGFIMDKHGSRKKLSLDDDFYGLTPLNDPIEPTYSADLVAITGLGGHAFVSWQNVRGEMWLRDYLPIDVPNLRVFTYGFSSTLWKTTSTATIADYACQFMNELRNCSNIGRRRPLILLGHSIGCMMIKDALIMLSQSSSKDDADIFQSVYAVYFLGAPNRGLNNDALLQIYQDQLAGPIIRDLGPASTVLNSMNESWTKVSKSLKIVTCYELCVTPTSRLEADGSAISPKRNGSPVMMVSRNSACYYTDNETRIPVNVNHSMLAKLDNQPGSAYHTVARLVKEHIQKALDSRHKEFNSALSSLKHGTSEIHATMVALRDLVERCADSIPDTLSDAMRILFLREDVITRRLDALLDIRSIIDPDGITRCESRLVSIMTAESRDIESEVSSLRDSMEGILRALSILLIGETKISTEYPLKKKTEDSIDDAKDLRLHPVVQDSRKSRWNPCQDKDFEKAFIGKRIYYGSSSSGISAMSNDLCKLLVERKQLPPDNSLFDDRIFRATCEKIAEANEARLVRDVLPLIAPSAEILALHGEKHLEILIENVNQSWDSAMLIIGDYPQPDYSVGFKEDAFTEIQIKKLEPFAGELVDNSYFKATELTYFPFLSCHVGCGETGLEIADMHNMHSMATAVRGIVELYRLAKKEMELNGEVLGFSVSHNERKVRIYGHYATIDNDKVSFYRHPIRRYNFTVSSGRDRWSAYQFTRNIYDVWVPIHLKRICAVIDGLSDELST